MEWKGNSYGPTHAQDNAVVVLGNVENLHIPVHELDRKQALRDALNFAGQHTRAIQLSSSGAPLTSLEWIWTTSFADWLKSPSSLFWIQGKPGSGKSTLVHYLATAYKTKETLGQNGSAFKIVHFFFDFRAGKTIANDEIGLLRGFLAQLCNHFRDVESNLADKYLEEIMKPISPARLLDILCDALQDLPTQVCGFVDGLDEYEGDHLHLGQTLLTLSSRTSMKMCLASRPEVVLERLFSALPTIAMQDHNQAAILAYIDHALCCRPATSIDIQAAIDRPMRQTLAERAQGVMIWVRLAVEAMLLAAEESASRSELIDILDHLPQELHDMYERVLSKKHSHLTPEMILILWTINGLGGSVEISVLYGLWDYYRNTNRYGGNHFTLTCNDEKAFAEQIRLLLGPFVELTSESQERQKSLQFRHDKLNSRVAYTVHGTRDYSEYSTGPTPDRHYGPRALDTALWKGTRDARLFHQTLRPFLIGSTFVRSCLPEYIQRTALELFDLRICNDLVRTATAAINCRGVEIREAIKTLRETEKGKPDLGGTWPTANATHRVVQHYVKGTIWEKRARALSWSLECSYNRLVASLQVNRQIFILCKGILTSPFMHLEVATTLGMGRSLELFGAESQDVDLKLAVLKGWQHYLKQSTAQNYPPSGQRWAKLLEWSLKKWQSNWKSLDLTVRAMLIARSDSISHDSLKILVHYMSDKEILYEQLLSDKMLSVPLAPQKSTESSRRLDCQCENNDYVFLWWVRAFIKHASLTWGGRLRSEKEKIPTYTNFQIVLDIIIRSGSNLDVVCAKHGSALHVIASQGSRYYKAIRYHDPSHVRYLRWSTATFYAARADMIVFLARLGVDPSIKHNDKFAGQCLRRLWEKKGINSLLRCLNIESKSWIHDMFTYYNTYGSWPDLDALVLKHNLGVPATWQLPLTLGHPSEKSVACPIKPLELDVSISQPQQPCNNK